MPLDTAPATIPSIFFTQLFKKCTGVQYAILGNILHELCLSDSDVVTLTDRTLAERAGVTEPSAIQATLELERKGLIQIECPRGMRGSSIYRSLIEKDAH
jgi:hypothetical protein